MEALADLALPVGSTSKFIGVTTFCEEDVSHLKPTCVDLLLGSERLLNITQIEEPVLNVGHS